MHETGYNIMLLEIQWSPLGPFLQAFKFWQTVHCSAGPRRIAILYETLMSGCDATQIFLLKSCKLLWALRHCQWLSWLTGDELVTGDVTLTEGTGTSTGKNWYWKKYLYRKKIGCRYTLVQFRGQIAYRNTKTPSPGPPPTLCSIYVRSTFWQQTDRNKVSCFLHRITK